jgi:predicted transcriptional regulator
VANSKKHLTFRLDEDVIRQAKILAVREDMSVSSLLARHVEESVRAADAYEAARVDALEMLKSGFHLGGVHEIPRDQLHDR